MKFSTDQYKHRAAQIFVLWVLYQRIWIEENYTTTNSYAIAYGFTTGHTSHKISKHFRINTYTKTKAKQSVSANM